MKLNIEIPGGGELAERLVVAIEGLSANFTRLVFAVEKLVETKEKKKKRRK